MYHVLTTSDPTAALSAPVSELATFTLHAEASKPALEVLVRELVQAVSAALPSAGAISPCWGPVAEKENVIGLLIGWTTVEVCGDCTVCSANGSNLSR